MWELVNRYTWRAYSQELAGLKSTLKHLLESDVCFEKESPKQQSIKKRKRLAIRWLCTFFLQLRSPEVQHWW